MDKLLERYKQTKFSQETQNANSHVFIFKIKSVVKNFLTKNMQISWLSGFNGRFYQVLTLKENNY